MIAVVAMAISMYMFHGNLKVALCAAFFRALEVFNDFASFGDRVGFHEFGTDFFSPWEIIDVDFEKMLERFI